MDCSDKQLWLEYYLKASLCQIFGVFFEVLIMEILTINKILRPILILLESRLYEESQYVL